MTRHTPEQSQEPSLASFIHRHRKGIASLVGVGLAATGCSVPPSSPSNEPQPTISRAEQQEQGEPVVDWDNLEAPVAVDTTKLIITPKSREKTAIESAIPKYYEWSPYGGDYTGVIRAIKNVKNPNVKQQAEELFGIRVADALEDLNYDFETYDFSSASENNDEVLQRVTEAVDAISDPKLRERARKVVEHEVAQALVNGDYDNELNGVEAKLLGKITDPSVADLTRRAVSGEGVAEVELEKAHEELQPSMSDEAMNAWGRLFSGSVGYADMIEDWRREYAQATKGSRDKTTPAAKSALLSLTYKAGRISVSDGIDEEERAELAAIRAQVTAAAERYPKLVPAALGKIDADLAEIAENEYTADMDDSTVHYSVDLPEIKEDIKRSDALVELIGTKSIRENAQLALDLDRAEALIPPEYSSREADKEAVAVVLNAIKDPTIKGLAKKAASGNKQAAEEILERNTDVANAIARKETDLFTALYDGSNSQADMINDYVEEFKENS